MNLLMAGSSFYVITQRIGEVTIPLWVCAAFIIFFLVCIYYLTEGDNR